MRNSFTALDVPMFAHLSLPTCNRWLVSFSAVLPLSECHMSGTIQFPAFSNMARYNRMHWGFVYIFSDLVGLFRQMEESRFSFPSHTAGRIAWFQSWAIVNNLWTRFYVSTSFQYLGNSWPITSLSGSTSVFISNRKRASCWVHTINQLASCQPHHTPFSLFWWVFYVSIPLTVTLSGMEWWSGSVQFTN